MGDKIEGRMKESADGLRQRRDSQTEQARLREVQREIAEASERRAKEQRDEQSSGG